jgi:hypothetical protein
MKTRIAILLVLLFGALLVTSIVLAQGERDARLDVTELSGGHYRLVSLDAGVNVLAGGGGYLLLGPASPQLRGSGCCCTRLPCVLRKH